MGANFSNFVNGQVSNISDNFSGSDWTNITGSSNQIIMEEDEYNSDSQKSESNKKKQSQLQS